jgi:hypothetical protein
MRTEHGGRQALRAALRAHGGTVAACVAGSDVAPPSDDATRLAVGGPAQLAASGPRTRGSEREYELLVEMIREGSQLHYGPHRVVQTDDPDLALLLGDQLYALGLTRLAALGDLEAVRALADVIGEVARASAAREPEAAASAWDAGARRVGWGTGAERGS